MPSALMTNLARDLRRIVLLGGTATLSDSDLLERFLASKEEAAFEALVRRHGPMVLGVCRRVLRNEQDAEDAFQATFLVLVRKAGAIWPRDMLANWLFGVAYRTARGAKTAIARRRLKERQVNPMRQADFPADDLRHDLQPILDEELSHLPNKYRVPIILCDLEEKSRQEAARQLGWLEGTLSGRLARARFMLAKRLRRRGVTISGAVLAGALTHNLASASVPPSLLASTVKACLMLAAGRAATALVSAKVAGLAEGVLRTMMMTKIKIATTAVLAIGLSIAGAGFTVYRVMAAEHGSTSLAAILHPDPLIFGPKQDTTSAEETNSPCPEEALAERDREQIVGSGKPLTKEFKFTDFNSVEIRSVFQVEITQGDTYQTSITADDNLFDYIKAAKEGSTLTLSLDSKDKSIHTKEHLKAKITMPTLRNLKMSGACHASVSGFKSMAEVKIEMDGASKLKGNLEATKLALKVSGASHLNLEGLAKEAKLEASGACHLDLDKFAIDQADIHLSGASHLTVQVKSKLDYSVSGASHFRYRGEPMIGRSEKTGASHVGHGK
jgi:RNA polymerase sigma factor (sigma-70 family)